MILNFYYLFVVPSIYFINSGVSRKYWARYFPGLLLIIILLWARDWPSYANDLTWQRCRSFVPDRRINRMTRCGTIWGGNRVLNNVNTEEEHNDDCEIWSFDRDIHRVCWSDYERILLSNLATIRTSSFHIVVIVDNPFTWPLNIFFWLATEISYQMPRVTNRICLVLKIPREECEEE